MCTKISLLVKPVFQHSMSDCNKRAVKTCLHVLRVQKLNSRLSDPNRSVFSYNNFCIFCSIKLSMQGIRKYEIFGESIAGKNKDIRVGSLQFSTLQVQLYYKDSASNTFPKMLSTLTGKFEKCVKILNEELPHFKARSVYSH